MKSIFNIGRALAIVFAIAGANTSYAFVVQYDTNGVITGVAEVDVNGTFYDVSFMEGSCNSLYGGCDSSLFAFQTADDAEAAASALCLDVFSDWCRSGILLPNPDYYFPPLVGCEQTPGAPDRYCRLITPFATGVNSQGQLDLYEVLSNLSTFSIGTNGNILGVDTSGNEINTAFDTTWYGVDNITHGVWSLSESTEVPAPASLLLFSLGLMGLGYSYRSKQKNWQGQF